MKNVPKVLVQGITGHQGTINAREMLDFGTKISAGVVPGKGGKNVHGIPVFENVEEAVMQYDLDTSMLFVPAPHLKKAAFEAMDNGIKNLVIVTENVPVHDTIELLREARKKSVSVLGPNCPGYAVPGFSKVGIMPNRIFKRGSCAVISRSGTLTYEVVSHLTENGVGISICMGIGGDPIIGTTMKEGLESVNAREDTESIVLIGEIGGDAEEEAAPAAADSDKRVVSYIVGKSSPKGKKMGHAGALIEGETGTVASKQKAFRDEGVTVADHFWDIPSLLTRKNDDK